MALNQPYIINCENGALNFYTYERFDGGFGNCRYVTRLRDREDSVSLTFRLLGRRGPPINPMVGYQSVNYIPKYDVILKSLSTFIIQIAFVFKYLCLCINYLCSCIGFDIL